MVAIIKTGNSLRRSFYYNENKIREGVAECIMAGNYPADAENLAENQRLNMLLKLAAMNENVTRNSVHISLNFDPSEQFSRAQLSEIAQSYMEKIGFGQQPFLVYQHHDAAHPHLHLVSVKVRPDGTRIETQNIGRNLSEKARKEIELAHGLVRAEESKQRKAYELKPVNAQKVQYGKIQTKRAIANVLDAVLPSYKYVSLPELNAVLRQYNVAADRGSEGSRTYKRNGLTYRILDEHGNKVGVPIKASDFHNNPTLKYLQQRFEINETARQPHKARVKNAIDFVLLKRSENSLPGLIQALEKEGIKTVLRQNDTGLIYGITYVDFRTKSVFNGSDLGKQYSAKAIVERCAEQQNQSLNYQKNWQQIPSDDQQVGSAYSRKAELQTQIRVGPTDSNSSDDRSLDVLFEPARTGDFMPWQLRKSRKKKQKKLSHQL
ncbi:relaxase/mobilization nuclease domain-containing protein [Dyadobacter sp. LJ53]|uniref:relaxase/mobilization nuclease domain-containing protein n=1 Tax=Dyadobacter chenwenxiniae TaxID=2906456 RepID=UPI001F288C46|nr:relaxase/mobilization nuclease domain-containing protein [Dyadobacter chenwenxiniae]MCF0049275.1 relaxase/mobilization nuclease domain-containing protein [Dyadobacter chenwenxiniae]